MTATTSLKSPRTRIRRVPANARYDRDSVHRVLARGQVAHVSFVQDGQPYCIPTLYARVGERVLIHGSTASRMVRVLASGAPACVTVTLLDGLVLARSAFETGANYESVTLLGQFRLVEGAPAKLAALEAFTEAVLPGRWGEVRQPTRQELKGTAVLELEIDEASVKTRGGPPDDDDSPDAARETWAGVIPVISRYGSPEPSPVLPAGRPLDPSIRALLADCPAGGRAIEQ
jgi:nitroimidazol reductase NimA-like FMN-containing flavoprotein (pyridoxamine 5'-phosphate oxidase superfamily)